MQEADINPELEDQYHQWKQDNKDELIRMFLELFPDEFEEHCRREFNLEDD
jgi:hypothetical protein